MMLRHSATLQLHTPLFRTLFVRHISHYERLGIPSTATKTEIKAAYLDKAKQCHPDLNPENDVAEFQKIQEAHDVLMDSNARAHYNAQTKQSSFYGNQQTHPRDGGKPRPNPNVRHSGFTNPYSQRGFNPSFGSKHRSNNDNYSEPGRQSSSSSSPPFSSPRPSKRDETRIYLLIGLMTCLALYLLIRLLIQLTKDVQSQRYKIMAAQREAEKAKRQKYQEMSKGMHRASNYSNTRASNSVTQPVKLAYDPDKKLFYTPAPTDEKLQTGAQDKFDKIMQTRISGDEDLSFDAAEAPEVPQKPISKFELFALKKDVRAKHKEYVELKRQYNELVARYELQTADRQQGADSRDRQQGADSKETDSRE